MKVLATFLFFLVSINIYALDVSVSHAVFRTSTKAYVEYYFHYVASTLEYKELESKRLQATLEATILIKQEDKIVQFDKFELSSPVGISKKDFQNLKRFNLEPGTYKVSIEIVDKVKPQNRFDYTENLKISELSRSTTLSDIQLLASVKESSEPSEMSKQGFSFEALPFDYLSSKYDALQFYTEIYRFDQSEDLYINCGLYSGYSENDSKLISKATKKLSNEEIIPFLKSFNIEKLGSGNFHLKLEIKNRDQEVLATAKKNFQRNNPTIDLEILEEKDDDFDVSFVHTIPVSKLNYYLKAHIPLLTSADLSGLNEVLKSGTDRNKRYFIHRHWSTKSPKHAAALFEKYMEVAGAIDKMYNSGFGYGFETDRGYIYLKYGRPTQSITVSDEISAPPYEIWAYDRVAETGQNNVKFIFYNPSLSHNDFKLLHSTCRGELSNLAWEVELYRDAITEDNGSSIDATSVNDNFNRNAGRLFNDL